MRQVDLEGVRRLFSEGLLPGFHKCFRDEHWLRHSFARADLLFEALVHLCCVGAEMLGYRAARASSGASGEQLLEVDQDLVALVQCLQMVLNTSEPLWDMHETSEVPEGWRIQPEVYAHHQVLVPERPVHTLPRRGGNNNGRQLARSEGGGGGDDDGADSLDLGTDEEDVDDEDSTLERYPWLTHLINLFGHMGGFKHTLQVG